MLIQDIKPPVQRVIHEATEKTADYYKQVRFWVKTSKYSLPIIGIALLITAAGFVAGISNNTRKVVLVPTTFNGNWNGMGNLRELDLEDSADLYVFNSNNSAYTNKEYVLKEIEIEENNSRTIPPVQEQVEQTTPEESQEEQSTSTEPVEDESTSTEQTPPESETAPPTEEPAPEPQPEADQPPAEEPAPEPEPTSPSDESTSEPTEEQTTSIIDRLFGRFVTSAQEETAPEQPTEEPQTEQQDPVVEEVTTEPEPTTPPSEPDPQAEELQPQPEDDPSPLEESVEEGAGTSTEPEVILPTVDQEEPISTESSTQETPSEEEESDPFEEKPTADDDIEVFNSEKQMVLSGFIPQHMPEEVESIEELTINLSLGSRANQGQASKLILEYRFDEDSAWNEIETLDYEKNRSNIENGGYLSAVIDIPTDADLNTIRDLEVRVTMISNSRGLGNIPSTFIDAVWAELAYKTGGVVPLDEKVQHEGIKNALVAVSNNFELEGVLGEDIFDKKNTSRSCSINGLSGSTKRGGYAEYDLVINAWEFGIRLGSLPNGVGAYFQNIDETSTGTWRAVLRIETREFTQPGSFGIPLVYFTGTSTESLPIGCRLTLVVEDELAEGFEISTESPAAGAGERNIPDNQPQNNTTPSNTVVPAQDSQPSTEPAPAPPEEVQEATTTTESTTTEESVEPTSPPEEEPAPAEEPQPEPVEEEPTNNATSS